MANTLTGLVPVMYESLNVVSRELVGFIPAVARNSNGVERAALNQVITIPIPSSQALQDSVAAVTAPNTGDQVVNNVTMSITKSKFVPIRWNGEEQKGQLNAGTYMGTLKQQFQEAFRALANQIDNDLWVTAYQNASRAYGTPGTTPMGTAGDLSDISYTRQILDVNGCPQSDLHFILGSSAVANMRGKQSLLLKVNESGSTGLLRQGSISDLPVEGFALHNSGQITSFVKGTGAGYTSTAAGFAVGTNQIPLITGAGTVNAGDVVTFAGDTNKYVVSVGIAAPGTITLGGGGLMQAIPAAATALTVGNSYTPNIAMARNAVQLITRPPALPVDMNGKAMDMADDSVMLTDPMSGITFEVALYRQFLQMVFHVRLAWGVQAIKGKHIATLQG